MILLEARIGARALIPINFGTASYRFSFAVARAVWRTVPKWVEDTECRECTTALDIGCQTLRIYRPQHWHADPHSMPPATDTAKRGQGPRPCSLKTRKLSFYAEASARAFATF